MNDFPIINNSLSVELCRSAWSFERRGAFEAGLLEFSARWAEPDYLPDVDELPSDMAAELLLRFASLLGYQGHFKKIGGSQIRARDILTGVLETFESLRNEEKAAESANHIALTYWRTGELAEARTWLEAAQGRELDTRNLHRLASIAYEMLVNVSEQKYGENIGLYDAHETAFRKWADDWIAASFYINAAVGFMESDRTRDAIACLEVADFRAERSSMHLQHAFVQNELALVYRSEGRYEKAQFYVDRGIEIFRRIGDQTREGMLWDTKASISLAQGDLDAAAKTIKKAIDTLKDGENNAYLAEAYTTEAKIFVWQDDFASGVLSLFEASKIAETYAGREFAKKLISQFEAELDKKNAGQKTAERRSNGLEENALELILPPSLASHSRYQAIRINNDHLRCVGIENGSLVISVESAEIGRGDLLAVSENASGEISCGFYDLDFGVLCVETCNSDPRLFDPSDVTIVGKIVGIVSEPDQNGLRNVTPIPARSTF